MNAPVEIIERFRHAHHNVAIMLAMGMTTQEISRRTGHTTRRLRILMADPTFQELIDHYRKKHDARMEESLATAMEEMGLIRAATIRQMIEHLEISEEEGELLPIPILLKMHGEMADRTGFAKNTLKTVNVSVDFATALDRAIARSGKARLIEGEILPTERSSAQLTVVGSSPPRSYRRA